MKPRERRMVSVAILVVAAAMIYALVWRPLRTASARTQAQVTDMRSELAWMLRAAGKLRAAKHGAARHAPRMHGTLLEVVDQVSRKQVVRSDIVSLSGRGDGRVKVGTKPIAFERFLHWLDALRTQRIDVSSMTMTPEEQGRVVVNLVLVRHEARKGTGS